MTKQIYVRAYTTKELAVIYEVDDRTFKRWIEPHYLAIGPKVGHFYTINQVEIIFEKLGRPGKEDF